MYLGVSYFLQREYFSLIKNDSKRNKLKSRDINDHRKLPKGKEKLLLLLKKKCAKKKIMELRWLKKITCHIRSRMSLRSFCFSPKETVRKMTIIDYFLLVNAPSFLYQVLKRPNCSLNWGVKCHCRKDNCKEIKKGLVRLQKEMLI